MLTRNICSEYGQYNIQCNGIGPGYIATPQTAPLRERSSRTVQDIRLTNSLSLRRLLLVGEILKTLQGPAAFLA